MGTETTVARTHEPVPRSTAPQSTGQAMKPKEHGAYAILLIPLISSLLAYGFSWPAICVAVAAIAGFLAHEPLLISIGNRGARAQRNALGATRRMMFLLAMTLAFGTVALVMGSTPGRISLIACLFLASISMLVSMLGWHRTYVGQLLGVGALLAPSFAIVVLNDQTILAGLLMWSGWWLGFAATTTGVRSVIAAQKRQPRLTYATVLVLLSLVTGLAILSGDYWPLAVVPMILASWYLHFNPPNVRRIRQIGWILVCVTVVSAILMTGFACRA